MEARISLVTLGVSDLNRAIHFYQCVLELPRLETPPEVAFFEMGKTWLSLYSREALAADAGVEASNPSFANFTLAHNMRSIAEVDKLMMTVADQGARIVKSAQATDWGGYAGYFADPDGFVWEIAWNPHFPHVD